LEELKRGPNARKQFEYIALNRQVQIPTKKPRELAAISFHRSFKRKLQI